MQLILPSSDFAFNSIKTAQLALMLLGVHLHICSA